MRSVDSLEKTLMLGRIGSRRRRGLQRMRWLDGSLTRWMWVWVNSGRWWWTGRPGVLQFMGSQRVGHDWATELNWNWTDTIVKYTFDICSWYVWYLWYLFCKILFTSYLSIFSLFQKWLEISYHLLEEEMATHPSILAWRIPRAEEPGRPH